MPRKKNVVVMEGEGFKDFMKGVNNFLKKTKIVSTVGKTLGDIGIPYASRIGSIAGTMGYGKPKKRRKKGAGVRVAGEGVRVAGAGKKKKK